MDLQDPKNMWTKLKTICSEVDQGVVYSIFQKFLHYPRINKPKRYNKSVKQIFAKVKYLYKHLQTTITLNCDLWDIIAIVIVLNSLHNNFDITIISLLETKDKSIDKIQSILQSKKAKNISKRTTKGTKKLAMAFKDNNGPKRKALSHKKYYNYHKLRHFGEIILTPIRDKLIFKHATTYNHRQDPILVD